MAKNKNTIITHSNYTLKEVHKKVSSGTIYERDYMTITPSVGTGQKDVIPYGNTNFKFTVRKNKNGFRKRKYGEWLDNNGSRYWTVSDLSDDSSVVSDEYKIKLKPNYTKITDFTYYGSAVELVTNSLTEVITNYPGQLRVEDDPYTNFIDSEIEMDETGTTAVYVDNPFGIDVARLKMPEENAEIELRYFCKSYDKYAVYDSDGNYYGCISDWNVTETKKKSCYSEKDITLTILKGYKKIVTPNVKPSIDGEPTVFGVDINTNIIDGIKYVKDTEDIVLYSRYNGEQLVLFTSSKYIGFTIRPIDSVIEDFFNNLSEFSALLLNRNSTPMYTCSLEKYKWTDYGITYFVKDLTWHTTDGWNLFLDGSVYTDYFNNLMDIAEFADEHFSNNLWQNIVHDSIKNMDRTHSNPSKDEDSYDYNIGTTRVKQFLLSTAFYFDELKRYIDGIKHVNNITYNEQNNLPDYFLTDACETAGWDITSVSNTLPKGQTVTVSYPDADIEYNLNDLNLNFYRALKLNSKAIFSRKGTREGVEMLLNLFGLASYDFAKNSFKYRPLSERTFTYTADTGDTGTTVVCEDWDDIITKMGEDKGKEIQESLYDYKIDEYIGVMTGITDVKNGNKFLYDAGESHSVAKYNGAKKSYIGYYLSDTDETLLQGLPVKFVYIDDSEGNSYKYLIPWFTNGDSYDGGMYFQMYGGWENLPSKDGLTSDDKFTIYDETIKYLNVAKNLSSLKDIKFSNLSDGDIYYIYDISDFEDNYGYAFNENTMSNYFVLNNVDNRLVYGSEGWENIPLADIENPTSANISGLKVAYLENIIDNYKGNNPHVGYGKYDDGNGYFKCLEQLFKYSIENDNFNDEAYDCDSGKVLDEIQKFGFNIKKNVIDNCKCWYFSDENDTDSSFSPIETTGEINNIYTDYDDNVGVQVYDAPLRYETTTGETLTVSSGADTFYTTEIEPFNPEDPSGSTSDEASANSIINTKNMAITFTGKWTENTDYISYIYSTVLPYLEQMIPSTTIWKVKINNEDLGYSCSNSPKISAYTNE